MQQTSSWPLWVILGSMLFSVYFAYHYMHGQRGLSQKKLLEHAITNSQIKLTFLQNQRMQLEHRTSLLHPDNPDMDMLDEVARGTLGLYEDGEHVILYNSR